MKCRVACVQFEPTLGDVDASIRTCERLLDKHEESLLTIRGSVPLAVLVFPEMAFAGYTFDSKEDVAKVIEFDDDEDAKTFSFLQRVAKRFDCVVSCGYARGERGHDKNGSNQSEHGHFFNAVQIVNARGELVVRANKHHLYYLDEKWAEEDTSGFTSRTLRLKKTNSSWSLYGCDQISSR